MTGEHGHDGTVGRLPTAYTRLVAILGHPVRHSWSPGLHNAAFQEQCVDMVYMAFDVPEDRLAAAVSGLRALGAAGANVTVPHKEKVVPLLDDVDSAARRIGAVNTIVNEGGALIGHNTDVHGFLVALERGWGRTPRGSRCLVLGAGGAARAVVAGLGAADAAEIWVYNRTAVRARDLCAEARGWSLVPCRPVADAELGFVSAQVDVIVNATSVGMGDTVKLSPVPVDMVKEHHVVVDLVYGPEPTALLRHTRAVGGVALDGLEMLLQQAARSYELWTGRTAPIEFMRRLATDG